jgi:hypothetical protein
MTTRVGWGIIDQLLSSITNLLGSVFAAQRLTKAGFGSWSVGFSVFVVLLGVSRSLATDPLTVRYSGETVEIQRAAIRESVAVPMMVGLGAGLTLAMFGLALRSDTGRVLAIIGLALPFLITQDFCRLALFMLGRTFSAAVNDLIWLIGTVVALLLVPRQGVPAWELSLCWSFGAGIAAAFGFWQLKLVPRVSPMSWLRHHHDLSIPFSADFLLVTGVTYLVVLSLTAMRGVESTAAFRGAQVLMGPVLVLFAGVMLQAAPLFARRARNAAEGLVRISIQLSLTLALVAVGWLVVLLSLPDRLGRSVLGASWAPARELLLATGLGYAIAGATAGPILAIRSQGDAKVSLTIRALVAPLIVGLGLAGASAGGAVGAAVGILIASSLGMPIWWGTFLATHRRRLASSEAAVLRRLG